MTIDRAKSAVAAAVLDAVEPFAIGTVRQRVEHLRSALALHRIFSE